MAFRGEARTLMMQAPLTIENLQTRARLRGNNQGNGCCGFPKPQCCPSPMPQCCPPQMLPQGCFMPQNCPPPMFNSCGPFPPQCTPPMCYPPPCPQMFCCPQPQQCYIPYPCMPPPNCCPPPPPPPCPPGPCCDDGKKGGYKPTGCCGAGSRLVCVPKGRKMPRFNGGGSGGTPNPFSDQPASYNNCNFYVTEGPGNKGPAKNNLPNFGGNKCSDLEICISEDDSCDSQNFGSSGMMQSADPYGNHAVKNYPAGDCAIVPPPVGYPGSHRQTWGNDDEHVGTSSPNPTTNSIFNGGRDTTTAPTTACPPCPPPQRKPCKPKMRTAINQTKCIPRDFSTPAPKTTTTNASTAQSEPPMRQSALSSSKNIATSSTTLKSQEQKRPETMSTASYANLRPETQDSSMMTDPRKESEINSLRPAVSTSDAFHQAEIKPQTASTATLTDPYEPPTAQAIPRPSTRDISNQANIRSETNELSTQTLHPGMTDTGTLTDFDDTSNKPRREESMDIQRETKESKTNHGNNENDASSYSTSTTDSTFVSPKKSSGLTSGAETKQSVLSFSKDVKTNEDHSTADHPKRKKTPHNHDESKKFHEPEEKSKKKIHETIKKDCCKPCPKHNYEHQCRQPNKYIEPIPIDGCAPRKRPKSHSPGHIPKSCFPPPKEQLYGGPGHVCKTHPCPCKCEKKRGIKRRLHQKC